MRYLSLSLIATVFIVGAGCLATPPPAITNLPPTPDRQPELLPGDVTVETIAINRDFKLNDSAGCQVRIAYPNVLNNDLPPNAQLETDQEIAKFISSALGSSQDLNGTWELENAADNYLADCQTEIQREFAKQDGSNELFTNLNRKLEIIYSVKLNEFHLLTLGLDEYTYAGGAHSDQNTTFLNIDRGGDKLLTLGDIINPENLKALIQLEKTKLLANNSEYLYPEITEDYTALLADTLEMTPEEQLEAYGGLQNFYLTPTSLITYYNTYEIAPYAAGMITVEIPYAEIKDFISLNGPLVPIIEKL